MTRGGQRHGAGRKPGTGKYGEKTVPVRLPESMVAEVREFVETRGYKLPLFESRVQAGVPTAADDHVGDRLTLNELLVRSPDSTFLVRVQGDSMMLAGINEGDLLVVDRSLPATNGKIVIAVVDGELTVKRLVRQEGKVILRPENPAFKDLVITPEMEFDLMGVVTSVVHEL